MRGGRKDYLKLLNQLKMVAVNSTDLAKRERMRDNMLRIISRIFDVTSVYICQHNFAKKHKIVRHEYIGSRANTTEKLSDLGVTYPESGMGDLVDWIYGDHSNPRILHLQDLETDDPEYQEFGQYDVATIIFSALYYDNTVWGYMEIWDSRRNRESGKLDIALINKLSQQISATILTADG